MLSTTLIVFSLSTANASDDWVPSGDAERVYRALSAKDRGPSCADVEALTETPVQTLLEIVDHAKAPPWAGMRAASCLVANHPTEIQSQMQEWVSHTETKGLAILVVGELDRVPSTVALEVAKAAAEGPLADSLKPRLAKLETAELQAYGR